MSQVTHVRWDRMVKALGPFGFIAVDVTRVHVEDLFDGGTIVRVDGNPHECIMMVTPQDANLLGCIGGWISDEA